MVKEEKVKEEKGAGPVFSTNQWIIVGFLFVLFFVLLKVLNVLRDAASSVPVLNLFFVIPDPFQSPMFFVMLVVGFFFVFFAVDWINSNLKTRWVLHPVFVLLFFFLCLMAFYIALFWYNSNYAVLSEQKLLVCVSDNICGPFPTCVDVMNSLIKEGTFNEYFFVDFWERFHGSAFMLFMWAGVFGWVTRFAVGKIKL